MSNYANLKNSIQAVIKTNGNNEITGQLLQNELVSMITTLGYGYQFMGIANPNTVPGTPDAKVFYIAYAEGIYTNFGGIVVSGLCVLKYATTWVKEDIPISGGGGGGGTSFSPNEEDLILTNSVLQFADRIYPENTDGKNYIIVRRGASLATQISLQNAIYEIRYDFNLSGGSLTIPANSELRFIGGSINNGSVVFNKTLLTGDVNFTGVTISGSVLNKELNVTWFGADNTGSVACHSIANNLLSVADIVFPNGTFLFGGMVTITSGKCVRLCHTTIQKSSGDTNPAFWLFGNSATLIGENRNVSKITALGKCPRGVVRLGFAGPDDSTTRNVLQCLISDVEISGSANGGQSSGDWDVALYMCSPLSSSSAASYFNTVRNVKLMKANVGLNLVGDVNANQFLNLYFEHCDDGDTLDGGAIVTQEITYNNIVRYPLENSFVGMFVHTASSSVSFRILGRFLYNSILGFRSEPGGNSYGLVSQDGFAEGNHFEFIGNNYYGNRLSSDFIQKNVLIWNKKIQTPEVDARTAVFNKTTTNEYYQGASMKRQFSYSGASYNKTYKILSVNASSGQAYKTLIRIKCVSRITSQLESLNVLRSWEAIFQLARTASTSSSTFTITPISLHGDEIPIPQVVDGKFEFYYKTAGVSGTHCNFIVEIEAMNLTGDFSGFTFYDTLTLSETTADAFMGGRNAQIHSLTTAKRNAATGLIAGVCVFDTDLGKPVWYNGTGWVDATGTTV